MRGSLSLHCHMIATAEDKWICLTSPQRFFIIPTGPVPYFSGEVCFQNLHCGTSFLTIYWGFWVDIISVFHLSLKILRGWIIPITQKHENKSEVLMVSVNVKWSRYSSSQQQLEAASQRDWTALYILSWWQSHTRVWFGRPRIRSLHFMLAMNDLLTPQRYPVVYF